VGDVEERAALFASDDTERFRQRWDELQASFVDGPREVVKQADELVSELMERLTTEFRREAHEPRIAVGKGR
jgi:hypothetical protein